MNAPACLVKIMAPVPIYKTDLNVNASLDLKEFSVKEVKTIFSPYTSFYSLMFKRGCMVMGWWIVAGIIKGY